MIETYTFGRTTWVQLIKPNRDQLEEVAKQYDIAPTIIDDLGSPTPRQKIEKHGDDVYVVLHIPAYKHSHSTSHIQEIDFIIGKDFIITAQYDTIDAMQKISKEAAAKDLLGNEENEITPGVVFVQVLDALYKSLENEINYLQDQLREIEDKIFDGQERQMVSELSRVARDLLDIKRILNPQRSIFENLIVIAQKSKSERFKEYAESVYEKRYKRIFEQTQNNTELLIELRETNNSLVSTNQNEVMKILTIMAFVTFPLTLITSIFGMNTIHTPLIGEEFDFWVIIGFMVLITIVMFAFFKFKKWL